MVFEKIYSCLLTYLLTLLANNIHAKRFFNQFELFALNFNFLDCLGLIDMLSDNQHGEIFACILLNPILFREGQADGGLLFPVFEMELSRDV